MCVRVSERNQLESPFVQDPVTTSIVSESRQDVKTRLLGRWFTNGVEDLLGKKRRSHIYGRRKVENCNRLRYNE